MKTNHLNNDGILASPKVIHVLLLKPTKNWKRKKIILITE